MQSSTNLQWIFEIEIVVWTLRRSNAIRPDVKFFSLSNVRTNIQYQFILMSEGLYLCWPLMSFCFASGLEKNLTSQFRKLLPRIHPWKMYFSRLCSNQNEAALNNLLKPEIFSSLDMWDISSYCVLVVTLSSCDWLTTFLFRDCWKVKTLFFP